MAAKKPLACIILAAGQGKRMKSARSKVLHEIAGRPLILWLLEQVHALNPEKIIIVTAPGASDVAQAVAPHEIAVQEVPRGTGDAVKAALPALNGFTGDVLILLGDMPLISTETLRALIARRHHDADTGLSVLGVEFENPPAFGRLVLGADGALARIVEEKDASVDERSIKLCNTGAFCVDGARLPAWLARLKNDNAQKEYYITDLVELAAQDDLKSHAFITRNTHEVHGVNGRADLAALEAIVQQKLRAQAMENGATLIDPASVFLAWDTKTGRDVVIEPNVFFGPGVTLEDNVHIKAFSHLEGAHVASGAVVGPFARLRPGADIGADCKIGNFVEVKNAKLGTGVKASHLGYIGDADVGDNVNFSCGAITVNYDGINKHRTVIGANAMIGSNVNLIAPVEIGDGAYIAAGSSIAKDVPPDALAVAREKPFIKEGWAAARRSKKKKAS